MLNRTIAISKQVNSLSIKGRLLYTWSIPFLDDYGRLDKDPEVIKATVVPMAKDITEKDITEVMESAKELRLVEELSDCYWFTGFDNHQSITENKKSKSKFEALSLGNKTTTVTTVSTTTTTLLEQKRTEKANEVDAVYNEYERIFNRTVKLRNADRNRKVKARLEVFSLEEIVTAFTNASHDNYLMGQDEKNDKFYATIDYFLRNDIQIEKWSQAEAQKSPQRAYKIGDKVVSKQEFEEYKERVGK